MENSKLNPKFTMNNFSLGASNRTSYTSACAIMNKPDGSLNPLLIYGGVGVGKTHLLHAIGNALDSPRHKLFYRTSEDFLNGVVAALKAGDLESFRLKLLNIDLLLLDDIQFFEGKHFVQREFLRTLDLLSDLNKQVVLVSNQAPHSLKFSERLKDRLLGGLAVYIASPDKALKAELLQEKASAKKLELSPEVLSYLADVSSTIRELEGTLNQLFAQHMLNSKRVTLSEARDLIKKVVPSPEINLSAIVEHVAKRLNLTRKQLIAKDNSQSIVYARNISLFLGKKLSGLSLPELGRFFKKHHTTVMHSIAKVNAECENNDDFKALLAEIEDELLKNFTSAIRS